MIYDAFLSYSHESDGLLAPKLERELQRFAKPWWKRRALRVFRDESNLSASPHLWASIEQGLSSADWFILLCSPDAAQSEWVDRELGWWLENRDSTRILPVVTSGELHWDQKKAAFDRRRSNCIPSRALAVWKGEPRWVDLRWIDNDQVFSARDVRFRDAIADIAATVHGVAKDEIASDEVRQHKRTIRTVVAAGLALVLLAATASVLAFLEARQRTNAETRARIAAANAIAAQAVSETTIDVERALLLGVTAMRMNESPTTRRGLLTAIDAVGSLVDHHEELGRPDFLEVTGDGRSLITASNGGAVARWATSDWSLQAQNQLDGLGIWRARLMSDDLLMVSAPSPSVLVDVDSLTPSTGEFAALEALGIPAFAVSVDGSTLYQAAEQGTVIEIVDLRTGERMGQIEVGSMFTEDCGRIDWIELSSRDQMYVSCGRQGVLFEIDNPQQAMEVQFPWYRSHSIGFNPSGRLLFVLDWSGRSMAVIDTETGSWIPGLVLSASIKSVSYDRAIERFMVSDDKGMLSIWQVFRSEDGTESPQIGLVDTITIGEVNDMAFVPSKDEDWESIESWSVLAATPTGVQEWNPFQQTRLGEPIRRGQQWFILNPRRGVAYLAGSDVISEGTFEAAYLDPDGRLIVDEVLVENGVTVRQLSIPLRGIPVSAEVNSLGDQLLIVSTRSSDVSLGSGDPGVEFVFSAVSTESGEVVFESSSRAGIKNENSTLSNVSFSEDGRWIVYLAAPGGTSRADELLVIGDLSTGKFMEFDLDSPVYSTSWTSDGALLVGGIGDLVFVDPVTGQIKDRVEVAECPDCTVLHISWEVDDTVLVTVRRSGIWSVDLKTRLVSASPYGTRSSGLVHASMSQDGAIVVGIDTSGRLHLWDRETQSSLVRPLGAHFDLRESPLGSSRSMSAEFLPDGTLVTSANSGFNDPLLPLVGDYEIFQWNFGSDNLIQKACELVSRELTLEEWKAFVDPDGTPSPVCQSSE